MARRPLSRRIQLGYLSALLVGWLVWLTAVPRLTEEEQLRRTVDDFFEAEADEDWDEWWDLLSEEARDEFLAWFRGRFESGTWSTSPGRQPRMDDPGGILRVLLGKQGLDTESFLRLPPQEILRLMREAEDIDLATSGGGPPPGPGLIEKLLSLFRRSPSIAHTVSARIEEGWGLAGVVMPGRSYVRDVPAATVEPVLVCVREGGRWKIRWPQHDPMACPPLWRARQFERESTEISFKFEVSVPGWHDNVGWIIAVGPEPVDLEQVRLLNRAIGRQAASSFSRINCGLRKGLRGRTILIEFPKEATWESVARVLVTVGYEYLTDFVHVRCAEGSIPSGIRINGVRVEDVPAGPPWLPDLPEQPRLERTWTVWPQRF